MSDVTDRGLLRVLLDAWDRNNAVLLNLLGGLSDRALEARALDASPSVAALFAHIHYVRCVLVAENAPDLVVTVPEEEWAHVPDREQISQLLRASAAVVREAVQDRVETGRAMAVHYDHPVLLLQHLVWHEGYHHGQIKLALKAAGCAMSDAVAGPLTWDVWMDKR